LIRARAVFITTPRWRSKHLVAQRRHRRLNRGAHDRLREFDDACLTPVHVLAPEEIKAIRAREHISQPVFTRYLNVSKNLVSDWERGVKKPGGPALRLLTVIQKKGLEAIA
jgi:putative transcriptional regulator